MRMGVTHHTCTNIATAPVCGSTVTTSPLRSLPSISFTCHTHARTHKHKLTCKHPHSPRTSLKHPIILLSPNIIHAHTHTCTPFPTHSSIEILMFWWEDRTFDLPRSTMREHPARAVEHMAKGRTRNAREDKKDKKAAGLLVRLCGAVVVPGDSQTLVSDTHPSCMWCDSVCVCMLWCSTTYASVSCVWYISDWYVLRMHGWVFFSWATKQSARSKNRSCPNRYTHSFLLSRTRTHTHPGKNMRSKGRPAPTFCPEFNIWDT